jgi:hypothetical protein
MLLDGQVFVRYSRYLKMHRRPRHNLQEKPELLTGPAPVRGEQGILPKGTWHISKKKENMLHFCLEGKNVVFQLITLIISGSFWLSGKIY